MKRALAAAALAAFGLTPALGAACEYNDASSASATPPVQVGSAPVLAATTVPAPTVAKAPVPNTAKSTATKVKAAVPDQKLVVRAGN
jgi:hypothetical protein